MQQPQCFKGFDALINNDIKSKLTDKYIIPPFGILDTKTMQFLITLKR